MKIAVFGAGGVGGYFGGRLAQGGHDVSFIARGDHLQALRSSGLQVHSFLGDFHISPVHAFADPAQVGPVDAVLVAVKAWQVTEAAQALGPMLGPDTVVLPLQNGVEAPSQLEAVLGKQPVLGGLCRISAFLAEPGVIKHQSIEPWVGVGELDGTRTARVEHLAQAFLQANLAVDIPANIQAAMWEKFLFIAAVSGVGAAARAPVGVIRSIPAARALLERALQEIAALAQAYDIALPEQAVASTLAFIDRLPPGVIPSMQRDLLDGKPSELEAQTGAVVRMARARGLSTPVHETLYAALLPQEQRARGQQDW